MEMTIWTCSRMLRNRAALFSATATGLLEKRSHFPSRRSVCVGLADVNADGNLDAVVGLIVYLGHGDGTLTPFSTNTLAWNWDIQFADFNADGNLDYVAGSSRGPIAVFSGDGTGNFKEIWRSSLEAIGSIGVADFDGDGRLDMAAADDDFTRIYLGLGDGTFKFGGDYFGQGDLVVADLNEDGQPDFMTSDGTVVLNQTFTKLGLAHTSSGAVLSWPSYTAGFMLESTESLAAPDWQRVPAPVSVMGDRYVVTNATTRPTQFFRLRRQ